MSSLYHIRRVGTLDGAARKRSALLVGMLALLAAAGCGGGSTGTRTTGGGPVVASVSRTITVGTRPSAIAVDSINNKIYVTDFGTTPTGTQGCTPSGADIRAIDGGTQSITIGAWFGGLSSVVTPFAVTADPANHNLYVLAHSYWSGIGALPGECGPYLPRMEVFDTTSFTQIHDIVVGTNGLDVNLSTGNIYLAGWFGNDAAVMKSGGSATPMAIIPVGNTPIAVAVNATTNKIYIVNRGSDDLSVIDGTTNSVVATITDPRAVAPVTVAVNPATNTIYVANSQSKNLTVIDGATDSVLATIPVGTSPSEVAVDSETNFIYVANAGNSQAGDPGNVTVIDGTTNATTTLTDPKAVNPTAIAVNSVTNTIYVANAGSNNVSVIDGARD